MTILSLNNRYSAGGTSPRCDTNGSYLKTGSILGKEYFGVRRVFCLGILGPGLNSSANKKVIPRAQQTFLDLDLTKIFGDGFNFFEG